MRLSHEFLSVLQPCMVDRYRPYTTVSMELIDEGDIIQFVAFTIFPLGRCEALL